MADQINQGATEKVGSGSASLDQGAWQGTSVTAEEIAINTINYNGLNLMIFSAGRQSQCQVT